jgi:hypothetical protein
MFRSGERLEIGFDRLQHTDVVERAQDFVIECDGAGLGKNLGRAVDDKRTHARLAQEAGHHRAHRTVTDNCYLTPVRIVRRVHPAFLLACNKRWHTMIETCARQGGGKNQRSPTG